MPWRRGIATVPQSAPSERTRTRPERTRAPRAGQPDRRNGRNGPGRPGHPRRTALTSRAGVTNIASADPPGVMRMRVRLRISSNRSGRIGPATPARRLRLFASAPSIQPRLLRLIGGPGRRTPASVDVRSAVARTPPCRKTPGRADVRCRRHDPGPAHLRRRPYFRQRASGAALARLPAFPPRRRLPRPSEEAVTDRDRAGNPLRHSQVIGRRPRKRGTARTARRPG
jgi:hypothetical protein